MNREAFIEYMTLAGFSITRYGNSNSKKIEDCDIKFSKGQLHVYAKLSANPVTFQVYKWDQDNHRQWDDIFITTYKAFFSRINEVYNL